MSKVSKSKSDRIKEGIVQYLFDESPKSVFTYQIAEDLVRDKEFVLRLLLELEKDKLVLQTQKNFTRKRKWALSDGAYNAYKGLL